MSTLVKFSDGSYGVRAYWFFGWKFRDLRTPGYTWGVGSEWFPDCKGTFKQAVNNMSIYSIVGEEGSDL